MARGGKRPGAGRKKGSLSNPRFADYVTDKDRKLFVDFVMESYMGDMRLTTWVGDQLFGKAQQPVDHTTKGKELPTPILHGVPTDNGNKED